MEERKKRAGSYTALLLILCTAAALTGHWFGLNTLSWFSKLSPILLIILGFEYLSLAKKNKNVQLAWGRLVSSLIISFIITAGFLGFQWFWSDTETMTLADSEQVISTDIRNVKIDNVTGSVTLLPHSEQTIKVKTDIRHPFFSLDRGNIELETYEKDHTYHIKTKAPAVHFFFIRSRPFVDLTIYVPDQLALNIDVQQKNGNIKAQSIHLRETFHGRSTNGRIELDDLAGEFNLTSTNGTITVQNIRGKVEAKTTNGKVNIDGNVSWVKARTTNGSITATSETVSDDWDLKTTNGNVTLTLPNEADAQLTARTTNGSVHAGAPFQINGKKVTGKLGDGKYSIVAKTTNGKLHIDVE